MANIGAFFDIDGTLHRDSLMMEHFKKLINDEVIDPVIWHNIAKKTFQNWDKRMGNFEDYLLEVAEVYLQSMKGMKKEHIEFVSNQVIDSKGDRVYRFTRDKINWHKEQGHKVIFISGSPDFLVARMAQKYDVTDYRGTSYLVDENNIFTGEIVQMWDSCSKHDAIIDFVKKYEIDLSNSYAYGDTNGDLSMLKLVAYPTAINPAKELIMNIKNDEELIKKTTVIIERKDTIYKMSGEVEIL